MYYVITPTRIYMYIHYLIIYITVFPKACKLHTENLKQDMGVATLLIIATIPIIN